jgi:hypothetical protein
MSVQRGIACIVGLKQPRPIVNIPKDASLLEIRTRYDDRAKALIKFSDRTEEWMLMPEDEQTIQHPNWKLGLLLAVNYYSTPATA